MKIKNYAILVSKLIRYNLKIIFANKFFFFLLAGTAFFLLVTIINLFNSESNPTAASVYYLLLVPGILLIFYPTTFGIQNDIDSRMLEVLFGIPNYRYKVWLVRIGIMYLVVFALLIILALLSTVALTTFPIMSMVFQLMFPVFFLGSLAFMFSTIARNGYGTAVIMVIIGVAFWISSGFMMESKWNLFLNPFQFPSNVNEAIWADVILKNRIYLIVGTILTILAALLNLQKREKFV
ncbi:MAG: hypothetical protein GXO75_13750 [Calditrichaeota bacterium]|nr:hypothetical protein [Calditrichota bacterium]